MKPISPKESSWPYLILAMVVSVLGKVLLIISEHFEKL